MWAPPSNYLCVLHSSPVGSTEKSLKVKEYVLQKGEGESHLLSNSALQFPFHPILLTSIFLH